MLFTVENAAAMAKRSHAPNSLRNLKPAPVIEETQTAIQSANTKDGARVEIELANVQGQVALASNRLTKALSDPKATSMDLDRLTRVLATLREDERKLSGRSLPPTVKASAQKAKPRGMVQEG